MQFANVGKCRTCGTPSHIIDDRLVTVPTAAKNNETASGTIVTTETWSGTHTLTGDVTVAEGAKLVIQVGTTINIPAGVFIDVEGAICAGSASCGATQGSASSQVRFRGQHHPITALLDDATNRVTNSRPTPMPHMVLSYYSQHHQPRRLVCRTYRSTMRMDTQSTFKLCRLFNMVHSSSMVPLPLSTTSHFQTSIHRTSLRLISQHQRFEIQRSPW